MTGLTNAALWDSSFKLLRKPPEKTRSFIPVDTSSRSSSQHEYEIYSADRDEALANGDSLLGVVKARTAHEATCLAQNDRFYPKDVVAVKSSIVVHRPNDARVYRMIRSKDIAGTQVLSVPNKDF
jgi:hypothetical protein